MDLSLDSSYDDLRHSVAVCCRRHHDDRTRATDVSAIIDGHGFDGVGWEAIGAIGVFELGAEGDRTAVHLVVAADELGRQGVHGPLAGAVVTAHADLGLETPRRSAVVAGREVAALADPGGVVPWGADATVVLGVDADTVWRGEWDGPPERVTAMSGTPWARGRIRPAASPVEARRAIALAHLAVAAWAIGRADDALTRAAAYAAERRQFGRPIGEFQGVAHPLAESASSLVACRTGVMAAAWRLDAGEPPSAAAIRLRSTRVALDAALVVHQVYGALGFIAEGPLGATAMQLREVCSAPPSDRMAQQSVARELLGAGA